MGRRGIIETLVRMAIREAVGRSRSSKRNSTKGRSNLAQSTPRNYRNSNDTYKTRYKAPLEPIQLASRGMHAYPVSGESFYAQNFENLRKLFSGREEVLTRAYLIPEPKNPWDKNAIAVVISEYVVGHIPRHTAQHFARFLGGRSAECGARFYYNSHTGFHSVELDCDFPPRLAADAPREHDQILGEDKIPQYTMGQITTRGTTLNLNNWGSHSISISKEAPHFGIARITEGFRYSPEVVDEETNQIIGFPYETISYDFNLFARSFGGSVRVRYKMEINENGRPKIWLDSSELPKFKTKKY